MNEHFTELQKIFVMLESDKALIARMDMTTPTLSSNHKIKMLKCYKQSVLASLWQPENLSKLL